MAALTKYNGTLYWMLNVMGQPSSHFTLNHAAGLGPPCGRFCQKAVTGYVQAQANGMFFGAFSVTNTARHRCDVFGDFGAVTKLLTKVKKPVRVDGPRCTCSVRGR